MPPRARIIVDERQGKWPFYKVYHAGKYHNLGALSKTTYAEALRRAAQIKGHDDGGPRPRIMHGVTTAWVERHASEFHLQMIAPLDHYAGDMDPNDFSLADYLTHLVTRGSRQEKRAGKPLKPETIRKYLRTAKRVVDFGHSRGWMPSQQMPRLPSVQRAPRDLNASQLKWIFDHVTPRQRLVLEFIVVTGCRPIEACRMTWDMIDMAAGCCRYFSKRKERVLWLPPRAIQILDAVGTDSGHVFRSSRLGKPYTSTGLRSVVRNATAEANASPHGPCSSIYALRHTAAQYWLDQGVAMEDVAKLLGHSDLKTVQVYAQIRDQRARAVAKGLGSALDGAG